MDSMEQPLASTRRTSVGSTASHLVASISGSISSMARSSSRNSVSHARSDKKQQPRLGDWTLGTTLGRGEFGKVKLGWKRDENGQIHHVAVKLMRQDALKPKSARRVKVYREINALKQCHHPNIVHLEQVLQNDNYIGIVIEYAPNGELFNHIMECGHLDEQTSSRMFAQLVSAVHYLHHKGMVHRDLKLENLMLDRHHNILVTDFGFTNSFKLGDGSTHLLMGTSCGSPCYAAPELVMSTAKYDGRKVDVWSCGVILYAMLAGYLPFDDDPTNPDSEDLNKLYRYITTTQLTFPNFVGALPRDLLKKILVVDPEERATLYVVRNHPWLASHASFLSVMPREFDESYAKKKLQRQAQSQQSQQSQHGQPGQKSQHPQAIQDRSSVQAHRSSSQPVQSASSVPSVSSATRHARATSMVPVAITTDHRQPHSQIARSNSSAASSAAAAAAAATHQRKQSIQAVPSRSGGVSPPVSYGVSRRSMAPPSRLPNQSQNLTEEVKSLGISENGDKRSRLPVAAKPRPISFQPTSSSAGYSLEGVSQFSLYSPVASQPRVELSRVPSKSGEISRPKSFVDASSEHSDVEREREIGHKSSRTPPMRPADTDLSSVAKDTTVTNVSGPNDHQAPTERVVSKADVSAHPINNRVSSLVPSVKTQSSDNSAAGLSKRTESGTHSIHSGIPTHQSRVVPRSDAPPRVVSESVKNTNGQRVSSAIPQSTWTQSNEKENAKSKGPWYRRHSAMPVPVVVPAAKQTDTSIPTHSRTQSRSQGRTRSHSQSQAQAQTEFHHGHAHGHIPGQTQSRIPTSASGIHAATSAAMPGASRNERDQRRFSNVPVPAEPKEGAVKKIFGYLRRRSMVAG